MSKASASGLAPEALHFLNGYRFEYTEEIRAILKQFGTDEATVDESEIVEYLRCHTEEIDLVDEIEAWREDLIRYGLDELTGVLSDLKD
jgi:death-on-curing protein